MALAEVRTLTNCALPIPPHLQTMIVLTFESCNKSLQTRASIFYISRSFGQWRPCKMQMLQQD